MPGTLTLTSDEACSELLAGWLGGRRVSTLRAYQQELKQFMKFLGLQTVEQALQVLFRKNHREANILVMRYRAARMATAKSATVARGVSALRSITRLARSLGLIGWTLEIPSNPVEKYRDTSGPGLEGFKKMMEATTNLRDLAIMRLLFDTALRRGEVAALNIDDVDQLKSRVQIVGKGRTSKEWISLPKPTLDAVMVYYDELIFASDPDDDVPLFLNNDPASKAAQLAGGGWEARRLTTQSIYNITMAASKRAGLARLVRPHGLRHASITTALDLTNGNYRAVQKHSRHRNVQTVITYDDNRKDLGGEVAGLVASA